jgi:hypothetical protein
MGNVDKALAGPWVTDSLEDNLTQESEQGRMIETEREDIVRNYARNLDKEPSEFINMLSSETQRAVWLLTEDLEVVWYSDYTYTLTDCLAGFRGFDYNLQMPNMTEFLRELASTGAPTSSVYHSKDGDYDVMCYPMSKDDGPVGYTVTLSKGIKSKLSRLYNSSKGRKEKLCSLNLSVLETS